MMLCFYHSHHLIVVNIYIRFEKVFSLSVLCTIYRNKAYIGDCFSLCFLFDYFYVHAHAMQIGSPNQKFIHSGI